MAAAHLRLCWSQFLRCDDWPAKARPESLLSKKSPELWASRPRLERPGTDRRGHLSYTEGPIFHSMIRQKA